MSIQLPTRVDPLDTIRRAIQLRGDQLVNTSQNMERVSSGTVVVGIKDRLLAAVHVEFIKMMTAPLRDFGAPRSTGVLRVVRMNLEILDRAWTNSRAGQKCVRRL